MMDIIVCAGSNLFRMYVTYRFIRIFLEETKLSRVKEVACYLLFWIVNTALYWCCIIKVDTLFSRILIYNHNQYENRRKTYGTESKIL